MLENFYASQLLCKSFQTASQDWASEAYITVLLPAGLGIDFKARKVVKWSKFGWLLLHIAENVKS